MEKKNPRYDVYRTSSTWFALGLVVSLTLVIVAFNWRTYETDPPIDPPLLESTEEPLEVPITEIPLTPPPPAVPSADVTPVPDEKIIPPPIEVPPLPEPPTPSVAGVVTTVGSLAVADAAPTVEVVDVPRETYEVEVQAAPIGGLAAFYRALQEKINYPEQARRMGIAGKVYLRFVVEKDGSIGQIEVVRGIGGGCDEAAIEALKAAPKWTPARQNGLPVPVRMTIPIAFQVR